MDQHLLSIVSDSDGSQVFMHLDLAGTEYLIAALENLRDELRKNDCPHIHFLSEAWGGCDLTEATLPDQKYEDNLVHHLKVYGWNEEWKSRHGFA